MIALCSNCLVNFGCLFTIANFGFTCIIILLEERKISVPPLPRQRGLTLVAICSKCYIFLTLGDGQSSNSSGQTTTHSKDRSQADGSSLDLEWEHEDGTGVTDQVSFIIKSPSSYSIPLLTNDNCKQLLIDRY